MSSSWEQRHEKAKQMTQLMRLRAKVQQLERVDYESFLEKITIWNNTIIPQCKFDFSELYGDRIPMKNLKVRKSTSSSFSDEVFDKPGNTTHFDPQLHNEIAELHSSFQSSIQKIEHYKKCYKNEVSKQNSLNEILSKFTNLFKTLKSNYNNINNCAIKFCHDFSTDEIVFLWNSTTLNVKQFEELMTENEQLLTDQTSNSHNLNFKKQIKETITNIHKNLARNDKILLKLKQFCDVVISLDKGLECIVNEFESTENLNVSEIKIVEIALESVTTEWNPVFSTLDDDYLKIKSQATVFKDSFVNTYDVDFAEDKHNLRIKLENQPTCIPEVTRLVSDFQNKVERIHARRKDLQKQLTRIYDSLKIVQANLILDQEQILKDHLVNTFVENVSELDFSKAESENIDAITTAESLLFSLDSRIKIDLKHLVQALTEKCTSWKRLITLSSKIKNMFFTEKNRTENSIQNNEKIMASIEKLNFQITKFEDGRENIASLTTCATLTIKSISDLARTCSENNFIYRNCEKETNFLKSLDREINTDWTTKFNDLKNKQKELVELKEKLEKQYCIDALKIKVDGIKHYLSAASGLLSAKLDSFQKIKDFKSSEAGYSEVTGDIFEVKCSQYSEYFEKDIESVENDLKILRRNCDEWNKLVSAVGDVVKALETIDEFDENSTLAQIDNFDGVIVNFLPEKFKKVLSEAFLVELTNRVNQASTSKCLLRESLVSIQANTFVIKINDCEDYVNRKISEKSNSTLESSISSLSSIETIQHILSFGKENTVRTFEPQLYKVNRHIDEFTRQRKTSNHVDVLKFGVEMLKSLLNGKNVEKIDGIHEFRSLEQITEKLDIDVLAVNKHKNNNSSILLVVKGELEDKYLELQQIIQYYNAVIKNEQTIKQLQPDIDKTSLNLAKTSEKLHQILNNGDENFPELLNKEIEQTEFELQAFLNGCDEKFPEIASCFPIKLSDYFYNLWKSIKIVTRIRQSVSDEKLKLVEHAVSRQIFIQSVFKKMSSEFGRDLDSKIEQFFIYEMAPVFLSSYMDIDQNTRADLKEILVKMVEHYENRYFSDSDNTETSEGLESEGSSRRQSLDSKKVQHKTTREQIMFFNNWWSDICMGELDTELSEQLFAIKTKLTRCMLETKEHQHREHLFNKLATVTEISEHRTRAIAWLEHVKYLDEQINIFIKNIGKKLSKDWQYFLSEPVIFEDDEDSKFENKFQNMAFEVGKLASYIDLLDYSEEVWDKEFAASELLGQQIRVVNDIFGRKVDYKVALEEFLMKVSG